MHPDVAREEAGSSPVSHPKKGVKMDNEYLVEDKEARMAIRELLIAAQGVLDWWHSDNENEGQFVWLEAAVKKVQETVY